MIITREVFVVFNGEDRQNYVVGLNESEGEPKASDQNIEVNIKHNEIKKECLETISEPGEVFLDLKKDDH